MLEVKDIKAVGCGPWNRTLKSCRSVGSDRCAVTQVQPRQLAAYMCEIDKGELRFGRRPCRGCKAQLFEMCSGINSEPVPTEITLVRWTAEDLCKLEKRIERDLN